MFLTQPKSKTTTARLYDFTLFRLSIPNESPGTFWRIKKLLILISNILNPAKSTLEVLQNQIDNIFLLNRRKQHEVF